MDANETTILVLVSQPMGLDLNLYVRRKDILWFLIKFVFLLFVDEMFVQTYQEIMKNSSL